MSNSEKEILEAYSVRLSKLNKENLSRLYSEGDFKTQNQMFEVLIENYFRPRLDDQKNIGIIETLTKENGIQSQKIKELELEIENLRKDLKEEKKLTQSLIEDLDKLRGDKEKEIEYIRENHIYPIRLEELNGKLLNFVAEREGKKRKQEWTIDDVINYFIHTRFELGQLNGDLESVPDHIVKQLKQK